MARSRTITAAVAGVVGAALAGTGLGTLGTTSATAGAAPAPTPPHHEWRAQTLADGLVSPLSLAVSRDGTRYVTANFAGQLLRQKPEQKKPRVIFQADRGVEVGAVSEHRGSLRFALSKNGRRGIVMAVGDSGRAVQLADVGAFERRVNPDARVRYGFRDLAGSCARQLPDDGPPAAYRGVVETHPYATLMHRGTTYVADAAANALLAIPRPGVVRLAAVIPSIPVRMTAERAQSLGFPDCVVGELYWLESVPTDVEAGRNGKLYVSTLPGGPEDGSLGANARIYKVDPRTGRTVKIADRLESLTGLAVARNGDIFTAELFRGRISKVHPGSTVPRRFLETSLPGDVEVTAHGLFATTQVLGGGPDDPPAGRLVRIRR